MALSRICQCYICDTEELTNRAVLPDSWAVLWDIPITICNNCLHDWEYRFGEKPALWIEGGVEIVL